MLPPDLAKEYLTEHGSKPNEPIKPLSGQELIARIEHLFTPKEAEDLARRIEEGMAEMND